MALYKKIILIVFVVVSVALSMCPTSFALSNLTVYAPCNQPSADGQNGYVEFLIERGVGVLDVLVCSWVVVDETERVYPDDTNVDPGEYYFDDNYDLRTTLSFDPSTGVGVLDFTWDYRCTKTILLTVVYGDTVNYYALGGIIGYGQKYTFDPLELVRLDSNAKAISYNMYGGNYVKLDNMINQSTLVGQTESFIVAYGGFSALHTQLNDCVTFLVSNYLKTDNIDKNLSELLQAFNDNLWLVEDIDNLLYQIYEYMTTNLDITLGYIVDYLYSIRMNTATTNEKLDIIIDLLSKSGEAEFTEADTSNLNDYYDSENSLLDDSNIDASSAVKVEIDQSAMNVIWSIIDSFLNIHPAIIGAVLTILSLGLIALILGR